MSEKSCATFRRLLFHVLLGQFVAFINSITGVSTTKLEKDDASYPLLQSLTAYVCLFIVYGPLFIFFYIRNRKKKFSNFVFFRRLWLYPILAFIDLEANFVIVKAYQYTDMISVQLLGCFTIPCVLVLSYFILKMRFTITHVVGCVIATGGLGLLVYFDASGVSRASVGSSVVKGDLLCILASVLYAISNVLLEWTVKPKAPAAPPQSAGREAEAEAEAPSGDGPAESPGPAKTAAPDSDADENERERGTEPFSHETLPEVPKYIPVITYLCLMSGFAVVFAIIQFFAYEWKTFEAGRPNWTKQNTLYQIMFGLAMLCIYTGMPTLFILTSAAFANISLLAVNIYGIIWNVTIFGVYPTPLFFVPYVIIIGGIVLYDLSDIRFKWCPSFNYPCGDPQVVIVDEREESDR